MKCWVQNAGVIFLRMDSYKKTACKNKHAALLSITIYFQLCKFSCQGTHHVFHIGGVTVRVQYDHHHLPFAKG
jgi:hypothetical protein